MTNADKIRAMTDEELVEAFMLRGLCNYIQLNSPEQCSMEHNSCRQCMLDWLKQEVEE